jgi:putative polyhydroxyalkanoate system protein
MSDVKVHHAHTLGLDKARELARHWTEDGAKKLGLQCAHEEGAEQDVITFERMGVSGTMTVTGTEFDLQVKLGMMMAPFNPESEGEFFGLLGPTAPARPR